MNGGTRNVAVLDGLATSDDLLISQAESEIKSLPYGQGN